MLLKTMNYSSLEDAYGSPFQQRSQVTQARKDNQEKSAAAFTGLAEKAKANVDLNKELIKTIEASLALNKTPATETFRVENPVKENMAVREKFTAPLASQPASVFTGTEQSEKLSRILRLIEQNRTGYEKPATQDMALYIFTGVFFLFTFDTFVMLGKSMRGK
jgi:hypothetical protein